MREHRQTFITKRDFQQISSLGLNAVRIPFSYWLFEGPRPGEPFLGPDVDIYFTVPDDMEDSSELGSVCALAWAVQQSAYIILAVFGDIGGPPAPGEYG